MPTPQQLKLLNLAWRQAGLTDDQYRTVLRNTAGVESGRDLMNTDLENVMAVLEDSGFHYAGHAADYFRNKVAIRGAFCGARLAFKVRELAAQQRYALPALCQRFSNDRTDDVDKLRPHEAWRLVEMLKAVIARESAPADSNDHAARGS